MPLKLGDRSMRAFMTLLTCLTAMTVSGCGPLLATSEEFYYHDTSFAPRKTTEEVAVFEQSRPRKPFAVLGRIVVTQGLFGSRKSVLLELRRKAALLGADAVVDVITSQDPARRDAQRPDTTHFSQSGNVSTSESWVMEPGSSIRLVVSGLAVRYLEP